MDRDATHRMAWERIGRTDERLRALPPALAIRTLTAPGLRKRRSAQLALLLAGGAGSLLAARQTGTWDRAAADMTSATGERREALLPDGTRLTLNTGSAVDLQFTAEMRTIALRAGEILVETAPDPRPLRVVTAEGAVFPIGTRFTVRQHAGHSAVAVLAGAVDIHPAERLGGALRLTAGHRADFDRGGWRGPQPLRPADTAWVDGMIVADDVALHDFIRDLARYRPGVLRCGEATADLRLSGTYPLANTDRVLAALTLSLPVAIEYRTRWWVTVARR